MYLDYLLKPLAQFCTTETFNGMSSDLKAQIIIHITAQVTGDFTSLSKELASDQQDDQMKELVRGQLILDALEIRKQLRSMITYQEDTIEKFSLGIIKSLSIC